MLGTVRFACDREEGQIITHGLGMASSVARALAFASSGTDSSGAQFTSGNRMPLFLRASLAFVRYISP